ncbi:MAG: hypothetical protein OXR64_09885 [Chloroflexota bacterium]|nr:hypothetical protein [Chloroflexota bacterium]MDE2920142.1 hypothetical protein [Chloroflexota bacterium]
MRRVWQWLRSSWGVAANLGVLLGLYELLTDHWGIAGDLFTALENPATQVVQMVALMLVPVVALATLMGVLGVLWIVTRWAIQVVDTATGNDRWARREFMACHTEIQSCAERLASGWATDGNLITDAGLRLRLELLTDHLSTLGIADTSVDCRLRFGWVEHLDQLRICAERGHLALARRLARQWSAESGDGP